MLSIQEYKADPCGALSIPYWKAVKRTIPPDMKIVHDCEFDEKLLDYYADEPYFRLMHDLKRVPDISVNGKIIVISPDLFAQLADMIDRSYAGTGICVSVDQIRGWTAETVYCPALWLGMMEDGRIVGSIICDFDAEVGEAAIEWLQVLPEYRGRGIAVALTCRALQTMRAFADFATVSGMCGNPTDSEAVYRRCGFQGSDVWHILKRRR